MLVRFRQWTNEERLAVAVLCLWCLVVFAAFVRWMSATAQAHGRLLFPGLPTFAIAVGLGLTQWAPRRWQAIVATCLAGAMFVVSGWVVPHALNAAYPTLAVITSAAQIPNRLNANLGDRVDLVGYEMQALQANGRRVLNVVAYWRATAPIEIDYTVTVQAFDPAGVRIGQLDSFPLSAMFPTRDWVVGEIFRDEYPLEIAPGTPHPVDARVIIGMYDRETGKALQAIEPDGRRVGRLTLGQVGLP
jgi:hypothetical protein